MLYINDFICKKIVTFDYLNSAFKKIKFKESYFNCSIAPLKKSDKLVGSASEMLYILYILPLILLEKIDLLENISSWQSILHLRKIVNILMAFKLSVNQIAILRCLINEYIEMRRNLFPDIKLKPKHHFLMHYPYLIQQFGPLRHLWTLRHESKHKYFKNLIKHIPNYKNILFLFATRHQLLQSIICSSKNAFNSNVYSDSQRYFDLDSFSKNFIDFLRSNIKCLQNITYVADDIEYRGIHYKKDVLICFGKDAFGYFEVCKIDFVLLSNKFDHIKFVGYKILLFYNEITGLFEEFTKNTETEICCVDFETIICNEPLLSFTTNNITLYYFKSAPFENN